MSAARMQQSCFYGCINFKWFVVLCRLWLDNALSSASSNAARVPACVCRAVCMHSVCMHLAHCGAVSSTQLVKSAVGGFSNVAAICIWHQLVQ